MLYIEEGMITLLLIILEGDVMDILLEYFDLDAETLLLLLLLLFIFLIVL
jgi:hypothetical protein